MAPSLKVRAPPLEVPWRHPSRSKVRYPSRYYGVAPRRPGGTRRGPIAPPLEVRVAAPLEVPGDKLLDKSFQV